MQEIKKNPIICQKYNYTLDANLMNYFQFESRITLSEDGCQLLIWNKKYTTDPGYVYEETPEEIRQRRGGAKKESASSDPVTSSRMIKSNSSCNIGDIQAILFGGTSSRFWIYRKHLISIDYDFIKCDTQNPGVRNMHPFFAWQCISLVFPTRTVDLVVKSDH